jgi:hypothetical protein
MFELVPVMMVLAAKLSAVSLLLIARALVPALTRVRIRPSVPPAIPVSVWALAPVKRTRAPVILWLFRLPVVDISAAFWKATLPALVTVKLLDTVVAPWRLTVPVPVVKVLVPVIVVAPLRLTVPLPVENVPPPLWAKLPLACK